MWENVQAAPDTLPLLKLPSSALTLWKPPALCHVTVSPRWMLSVAGVKTRPDPPTATSKVAPREGRAESRARTTAAWTTDRAVRCGMKTLLQKKGLAASKDLGGVSPGGAGKGSRLNPSTPFGDILSACRRTTS